MSPQFPPGWETQSDGRSLVLSLRPGASKKVRLPESRLNPAMQGSTAPGSPREPLRGSPALFRKLLVNQSIRLQRRFTVAHPLW